MAPFFSRCSFISGSPPPVWKFREIHETREYRGFSYRGERLKIVLRTWFNEGIRDWRGVATERPFDFECHAIARRAGLTGSRITNRAPVAGSVHMSPPRLRSVCRAKANPSPSPSGLPHVTKGSNRRSRTWSGIPGPESSTAINTPSTLFCAQMFILPPCGIASMAFAITLKKTRSTGERSRCNIMPSGTPKRTWTRSGFFVANAESDAATMTSRRSHTPTTAGSPWTTLIRSDTNSRIRSPAARMLPASRLAFADVNSG